MTSKFLCWKIRLCEILTILGEILNMIEEDSHIHQSKMQDE